MDIHNKTKEQLIAELQELQQENSFLKLQNNTPHFTKLGNIDTESEDYFELIFNTSPDAAIISRLSDSKVLKVNDSFTIITGYSRQEALNSTSINLNLWKNLDQRNAVIDILLENGCCDNFETEYVRKDGTSFNGLTSAKTFLLDGVLHIYSISRDISKIKQTEDLLRKSENEIQNRFAALNSIFESSQNIIIFSLDVNYCYTAFTTLHKQTMKLIWGVDIAVGMNMLELIQHPTDRKKAKDNFDKVLSGEHLRFEEEYGDSTLHRAYYEDIYNPIIDNNGNVVGLSVFVVDITDRKNAENENERTQKLLEESQRIGKIGGWEFNIDTKELLWTKEMYSIHEVDATYIPMVHKRLDFYTPESLKVVDSNVNLAIEQGGFYEVEVEIITAKGNRKLIRTTGEADLENRRIFGYFQDITERKLAEQALKESEEKFRLLFEQSPEAITITNRKGEYIDCNSEALKDMNISSLAELQKYLSTDFYVNEDDRDRFVRELTQKGFVRNFELKLKSPERNGTQDYLISADVLQYQNSEPLFIVWCRNITERKQAEKALKESEEKYRLITEYTVDVVWVLNLTIGKFTYVSPSVNQLRGITVEEAMNETLEDSITPNSIEIVKDTIAIHTSNFILHPEAPNCYINEIQQYCKNGDVIWVEISSQYRYNPSGEIEVVGVSRNIEKRKKAEQELKESEEKYRFIVDNAIEGMYRTSIDGKALMANRALANTLGYASVEEYLNEINDAAHQVWVNPEQRAEYISLLDKHDIIQGYECQMKKKDGTPIWVSLNAKIIRDEAGNKIYSEGFTEEITNRKKVELELKESEEKYRESQQIGNVAHWEFNFRTNELFWSDQLYKIYELSKADFEPDLKKALAASHIDDQESIRKAYFDAIQHKSDFDLESRIITPDGDIKHVITRAKPKFDENGNPASMIGTVVDITERKKIENELKKSQEELRNFSTYLLKVRENERAEITLEIHDGIAQFLVALKVEMGLYLKKISNSSDAVKTEEVKTKMQQLVSQVDITLKSARMIMNGLRPDQLDLLGLVEATEVYLHNFEEIHHIKCSFENTVSEPIIQKEQSIVLFRILQESLTNILKHAKANSVTVKLSEIEGNLMMEIIDNGIGYDEKNISRPDSYGVISMREQVKRLDGIFSITSKPGQGTLVRVEIPYKELKISNTLTGK